MTYRNEQVMNNKQLVVLLFQLITLIYDVEM